MKANKNSSSKKERNMEELLKKDIPEDKLKTISGGGAFDDVPTVDVHEYDHDTKGKA